MKVTQKSLHQQKYKTNDVHDQNTYNLSEFMNNQQKYTLKL